MKNITIATLVTILNSNSISNAQQYYTLGSDLTQSINLGENEYIQFSQSGFVGDGLDAIIITDSENFSLKYPVTNGSLSSSFLFGKKIYGPCNITLDLPYQHSRIFMPCKVEKIDAAPSTSMLMLPANFNDSNVELIMQGSSDAVTWINVNSGLGSSNSSNKYYRLAFANLSNESNELVRINTKYGFANNSNYTEAKHTLNFSGSGESLLCNLQDGEVFTMLSGMISELTGYSGQLKVYQYINHPYRELEIMEEITSSHNSFFGTGNYNEGPFIVGPAIVKYRITGPTSVKARITYKIRSEGDSAFIYSGSVAVPAGLSSYNVGIEYSSDLLNWFPTSQGNLPAPDTQGTRFYRVALRAQP
jgi:hypothetical protein